MLPTDKFIELNERPRRRPFGDDDYADARTRPQEAMMPDRSDYLRALGQLDEEE